MKDGKEKSFSSNRLHKNCNCFLFIQEMTIALIVLANTT